MAMLYLLHRFNINTVVVHCNYQLRGDASDKDQQLVEDICLHWNVECVSLKFDSVEESEGENFQDWARKRRYRAFNDLKKEYDADLIVTAHHQDDQIETILQKILRGAGLSSWRGMDIVDGDLFRPFLNVSKSDIMDFVEEFNVPYRIDRTNEESTYARNFIRNHWFPDLNRLFPGWKNNLLLIPNRSEEFQTMAGWVLKQMREGERQVNRNKFLDLPSNIKPAVLLEFIKETGLDIEVSQGFLENLDALNELESGRKIQISAVYFIRRDRSVFKLVDDSVKEAIHRILNKDQTENSIEINGFTIKEENALGKFSLDSLHLDIRQLTFPLTIRNWKSGDRFQPLGMNGSQLISDHLTNRKVPSDLKNQALVLESFDGSICALIFPANLKTEGIGTISEKVRCTSKTNKTLTIRKVD